jgi:hypothetical protein
MYQHANQRLTEKLAHIDAHIKKKQKNKKKTKKEPVALSDGAPTEITHQSCWCAERSRS